MLMPLCATQRQTDGVGRKVTWFGSQFRVKATMDSESRRWLSASRTTIHDRTAPFALIDVHLTDALTGPITATAR